MDIPFDPIIQPGKFAKMVGVTLRTLQRWDKAGLLVAGRTPTNRRYYTEGQYLAYRQQGLHSKEEGQVRPS